MHSSNLKVSRRQLELERSRQKVRHCGFKKPPPAHSRGGASRIQEQRLKKKKEKKKLHQWTVSSSPRLKPCLICGQCWGCRKKKKGNRSKRREKEREGVREREKDNTNWVAMEIVGFPGSFL